MYQITTLYQHIGCRESDGICTDRVHCKKTNIDFFSGERLYRFTGSIKHHIFHRHAQALSQFCCQVDRYPHWFLGDRIKLGQYRVSDIDAGAKFSCGCKALDHGVIKLEYLFGGRWNTF